MNDVLRNLIDGFIGASAVVFRGILLIRLKTYRWNQARLRRKYGVCSETPIRGYEDQQLPITGGKVVCAYTSGSTNKPKRIPYDWPRLLRTRLVFIDTFWRYLAETPLKNRSIFIFSSMGRDNSLSSMLLHEAGPPPYLVGLHAPHLIQNHPAIREAAREYGETAVRLWILTVSNPGVIYATNPSTIAAFFHDVYDSWDASRRLVIDHDRFRWAQKRIASRGACNRLRMIAGSPRPLSVGDMFPALGAFSCWDGGYVSPFIEQIRRYLPDSRYRHLPMYSMSTETIETIGAGRMFLPLAPGVLYEFIEDGLEDQPANVLRPGELEKGKRYSMVVSDGYGLRRYQTDDLFSCVGMVDGIPDLRFAKRRNLSYSFTGEKLTADQLKRAYQEVESRHPGLRQHGFLTCFPSKSPSEPLPRYRLVYVRSSATATAAATPSDGLAAEVEQTLGEFNLEFKLKIESRRLGRMKLEVILLHDFIRRVRGPESQFKFLPLYTKLWETQTTAASGS
jgi:hypothetical protein